MNTTYLNTYGNNVFVKNIAHSVKLQPEISSEIQGERLSRSRGAVSSSIQSGVTSALYEMRGVQDTNKSLTEINKEIVKKLIDNTQMRHGDEINDKRQQLICKRRHAGHGRKSTDCTRPNLKNNTRITDVIYKKAEKKNKSGFSNRVSAPSESTPVTEIIQPVESTPISNISNNQPRVGSNVEGLRL